MMSTISFSFPPATNFSIRNPQSFSKFFKTNTNLSPLEFRASFN
ncbi:hypothetical protein [Emticicia sp. C21]|nr:hypothetical protein [Emticicia sp. C21]